jgi:hypothetical protein
MSWNYTDASGREIIRDGEATKTDREIAYEQNVTGLERAWESRIESYADNAVSALSKDYRCDENASGLDMDGLRLEASERVAARLFDSLQWENVKATDISDIAYEAVSSALDRLGSVE